MPRPTSIWCCCGPTQNPDLWDVVCCGHHANDSLCGFATPNTGQSACRLFSGAVSIPPHGICHCWTKRGTSLSRNISLLWAFIDVTCAVLRLLQPRFLHRIRVNLTGTPKTIFLKKVQGTPSSAPPQVPDNRPLSRGSPVEGNPILCLRCPALEVLPRRLLETI